MSGYRDTLHEVIHTVPNEVREKAAAAAWKTVHSHPGEASCQCVAVEVIRSLYDQGYRLVVEGQEFRT